MNILDLIILIPMAFGAFMGFREGLLMEISTLIAFLLATVLGFKFWQMGVEYITPFIGKNTSVIPVLGFLLVFAVVLILVLLASRALKAVLTISILGGIADKIAGALVGALKWAFGFSVVLWLMESASIGVPAEWANESFMFPFFVTYGPVLINLMSKIIPYTGDLVEMIKEYVAVK